MDKMNSNSSLLLFAFVAILSLGGMLAFQLGSTTANAVYEQPSNNKFVYVQSSTYLPDFDYCSQYRCDYPTNSPFFGEFEPAFLIGVAGLSGPHNAPANLICGCSDGRQFQIRPDRVAEGY